MGAQELQLLRTDSPEVPLQPAGIINHKGRFVRMQGGDKETQAQLHHFEAVNLQALLEKDVSTYS